MSRSALTYYLRFALVAVTGTMFVVNCSASSSKVERHPQPTPKAHTALKVPSPRAPRLLKRVAPQYPEGARLGGVQGIVILEAAVSKDGTVTDAKVLRGIPELNAAAVDAVLQYEYEPALVGGRPAPALLTVTVTFRLPT